MARCASAGGANRSAERMQLLLTLIFLLLALVAALVLFSRFIAAKVERAFRPSQWLEVEGERIHYRSLGEGPALVLVHGLAGQMKNFDYLPLAQLAQRYRVILVDRPGSGLSPRRDESRAGIAAQAKLVVAFIRALRLPQPPLLVGHSLGGAISLGVALQDPDAVAGLALVAPLTHHVDRVPVAFRGLAIRTPWLRRFVARVFAVPLGMLVARRTVDLVFAPEPAPADFPVRGGGLLNLRPAAFRGASIDLAAVEQDLPAQQERYREIRLPVHVLYGEGDAMLDWRVHGEALRGKLPALHLRVIPGGHMLPVTQPTVTAEWLEEAAQAAFGRFGHHSHQ